MTEPLSKSIEYIIQQQLEFGRWAALHRVDSLEEARADMMANENHHKSKGRKVRLRIVRETVWLDLMEESV